ncbi:hypothetical protein [Nocardia terpenica]|uniref:hypothetical protein n=1 Tax=Nocardia terpenica TaxID=455432 RepID=UPI00142E0B54|nr:hypothetical protein [Nocardia terpenica]
MTTIKLLPVPHDRRTQDRLEILTALIAAPSFDPLFRDEIIKIPLDHRVYRWNCLVTDCPRPKAGRGDLCSAHRSQWREQRRLARTSRADFMRTAHPVDAAVWVEERPCRVCSDRPARNIALVLCDKHQFRWYRHLDLHGGNADFGDWLTAQRSFPGYGCCLVRVCPDLANSPLGLCARHESRYESQGRPGLAALPSQWANRYERQGLAVPVTCSDRDAFRCWCANAAAVLRPSQVNLRGLRPLLRSEIQWACSPIRRTPTAVGNCRGCRIW